MMISTLTAAEQFAALTRGDAEISTFRDVIVVVGPDTEKFLQGQLSQDIAAIEPGTSKYTLHLQPNGRVIALARITRIDSDTVILDTEEGCGERVHAALSRFLIRTKCTLTLTVGVPTVLRPGRHADAPPTIRSTPAAADSLFPLAVSGLPFYEGVDILGRSMLDQPTEPSAAGRDATVDAKVAEAFRVSVGIPRSGAELLDSTIPSETGLTDAAVTFGKGCYVGQELVERIDSRGRTVRFIRRLVSAAMLEAQLSAMANVTLPVDIAHEGETIGHLTSVAIHPVDGCLVALGLVRAHIAVETEFTTTLNGVDVVLRLVS